MYRLLLWAAVLFALVGAVGPVGAGPSDEARRMPVGPPDAGTPAPLPIPAAPPPAAPALMPVPAPPVAAPAVVPGPALTPQYTAPAVPAVPQAQVQQPAATATAARQGLANQGPAKGAQNSGHRWRLFHRRSGDEVRQSAKPGLFKRR